MAVTGSIAAYKIPQLVRLLLKQGAEVKVLQTAAAEQFVTPLTLATVSRNPVFTDLSDGAQWNNHVALGLWADVMLVAPCSANTLAKLAHGLCDNIVSAVYLSARCPVFIAPAMDEDMWLHPTTVRNIGTVKENGNMVIPVGHGSLASGLTGDGRMAEPEEMVQHLHSFFDQNKPLKGLKALVTAGPTYERIDPVRFIGNFSTGKMGIAIADALAANGANVTLICGPTHEKTTHSQVTTIAVESAQQMYDNCIQHFENTNIAVMAAAVADYRPQHTSATKMKKDGDELHLDLVKNPDILAHLGKIKVDGQTLIGFALETNNELEHALEKLKRKNADAIVLNSLNDEGAGFGHDTNKITIIGKDGTVTRLPLLDKKEVAAQLVTYIIEKRNEKKII